MVELAEKKIEPDVKQSYFGQLLNAIAEVIGGEQENKFMQAIENVQEWLRNYYPNGVMEFRDNKVTLTDKTTGKIIKEFTTEFAQTL